MRKMYKSTTVALAALLLVTVFSSREATAQGAWNLKYLPVDSVNESLVWKDVRIDYKGHTREKFKWTGNTRQALSKHDTVSVKVRGKSMRFVEDWKIYVDHGILSEQTLRRLTKDSTQDLTVREVIIRAVDKSSITVEMYLYRPDDRTKSGTQFVTIKKSGINGIVIAD